MRESGLARDAFFVTTKVATVNLARTHFLPSFAGSLERLGIDQIDLTLIHWPSIDPPCRSITRSRIWPRRKRAALDEGDRRLELPDRVAEAGEEILGPGRIIKQSGRGASLPAEPKAWAYCTEKGIAVTAYLPLARGKTAEDLSFGGSARSTAPPVRRSRSPSYARGLIVIPATSRPERLAENLGALDVILDEEDIAAIRALDRGERLVNPASAPAWD